MDPNYKPLHREADKLQHRVNDWIDDRGHPAGSALLKESREVMEDIERNKAPRSVEDRIKRVQQYLRQDSPAISPDHAKTLEDDYEDLRRGLRSLPNY
jgi:hypothetical protein